MDENAGPEAGRRNAAPDRKLGERCQPFAPIPRPRLGKKIAGEVTKHDIATLSNEIVAGKLGAPRSANARHMRRAASGLFNWAAEAGRDYVTASLASTCRSSTRSIHAPGAYRGRDQDVLARPRPG